MKCFGCLCCLDLIFLVIITLLICEYNKGLVFGSSLFFLLLLKKEFFSRRNDYLNFIFVFCFFVVGGVVFVI